MNGNIRAFLIFFILIFNFFMGGIVFLSYLLFGLQLPALEFVGCWVELGLGAKVRTSWRPYSNEYSLGSEVLC